MAEDGAWRPLRRPPRSSLAGLAATPFGRLALTHVILVAGDTFVTMALAGSLFFSISPADAKPRVALYLALTMAPFAVVAPLLGPALDRSRSGRRLIVVASGAGRAVACGFMAGDLDRLLLFPEAFVVLVLSKAYAVAKSALVPATVGDHQGLVEANARLALAGVAVGLVAAVPGVAVLKLAGADWVLRLASMVFAAGAVAAVRLPPAPPPEPLAPEARAELKAANVVLAATAMGLLRGIVGFLTFLVAFSFRRAGAPAWWFGVILATSMAGTLAGNVVAPRLRDRLSEERLLVGSLAAVTVAGVVSALGRGRLWAAVLAAAVGLAAGVGKLAFDSLVQRDAPDAARGRFFARFETRFQLTWVVGAFLPVVLPVPSRLGYLVIGLTAAFAAVSYSAGLRATHRRPAGAR